MNETKNISESIVTLTITQILEYLNELEKIFNRFGSIIVCLNDQIRNNIFSTKQNRKLLCRTFSDVYDIFLTLLIEIIAWFCKKPDDELIRCAEVSGKVRLIAIWIRDQSLKQLLYNYQSMIDRINWKTIDDIDINAVKDFCTNLEQIIRLFKQIRTAPEVYISLSTFATKNLDTQTKICRYWKSMGRCNKGNTCTFAHAEFLVCKNFENGYCPYGNKCHNKHI